MTTLAFVLSGCSAARWRGGMAESQSTGQRVFPFPTSGTKPVPVSVRLYSAGGCRFEDGGRGHFYGLEGGEWR